LQYNLSRDKAFEGKNMHWKTGSLGDDHRYSTCLKPDVTGNIMILIFIKNVLKL